jgi:hypothetical protein
MPFEEVNKIHISGDCIDFISVTRNYSNLICLFDKVHVKKVQLYWSSWKMFIKHNKI